MELRQLRSFAAVAETLNFRRAAERLHLTQPGLSAQIRGFYRRDACSPTSAFSVRCSLFVVS